MKNATENPKSKLQKQLIVNSIKFVVIGSNKHAFCH